MTYITLEEMNIYIDTHYISTDPLRSLWTYEYSEKDRTIFLHNAYIQLQQLPYVRTPGAEALDALKAAQAEQALLLASSASSGSMDTNRSALRRDGVIEYTIGDLTEKFAGGVMSDSAGNYFGLSPKAFKYVANYLQGGYRICTATRKPYGCPR